MLTKLRQIGQLVRFSHTLFALPFALSMYCILLRDYEFSFVQLALILCCLVSARTAAMAYNRLVDRNIDADNPRTHSREIPAGVISIGQAWGVVGISSLLFIAFAAGLGWHCAAVAPVVLLWLFFYSWTKRFTHYCHLVLGIGLALAPGGVWYALTAQVSWEPLPLMFGVLFWVAGFDILYACQDADFDHQKGLRSIPSLLGLQRAFYVAALFHITSVVMLTLFGISLNLGAAYYVGTVAFGLILWSEYRLVDPSNLAQIDKAFFERNALASLVYLLFVGIDVLFCWKCH